MNVELSLVRRRELVRGSPGGEAPLPSISRLLGSDSETMNPFAVALRDKD